jgi:hypothetical protein
MTSHYICLIGSLLTSQSHLRGFGAQEFHYIHVIRTLAYKNFFKCFVAGLDTDFRVEIELGITASNPYGVFKA